MQRRPRTLALKCLDLEGIAGRVALDERRKVFPARHERNADGFASEALHRDR